MSYPSRFILSILIVLVLFGCETVPPEVLYPGAATLLPSTTADMNTSGYWISRHPDPDGIILDQAGIAELNAQIQDKKLVRDLANLPQKTGAELRKELEGTAAWIGSTRTYQVTGKKVDKSFMAPLIDQMNYDAIPENIDSQYGFLIRQEDIRVLPTRAPLYDKPGDAFIDNLQASNLDRGTPLIILHQSKDGQWLYAVTELVGGWIPADCVAFAAYDVFIARYQATEKIIVTDSKADLYTDKQLTRFCGYARMGTRLIPVDPIDGQSDDQGSDATVAILLPDRDDMGNLIETKAWVDAKQISKKYLDYTARTIYQQAFRLLNMPYGWGGSFGEQDCSQFLCEIFSTVGITLPRNSSSQAKAGMPIAGFTSQTSDSVKTEMLISSAIPGATLLRLPGHIMLYLGTDQGKQYIIHETWAYKEKRGFTEITRLINRVAVSTLELGDQSTKGSHLHRLTTATVVTITPPVSATLIANQ